MEKILVKEFKALARKVGRTRWFWEKMVDEMLKGGLPHLNLKVHYQNPKEPIEIAKDIAPVFFDKPYNKLTEEQQNACIQIIKIVKEGLDY